MIHDDDVIYITKVEDERRTSYSRAGALAYAIKYTYDVEVWHKGHVYGASQCSTEKLAIEIGENTLNAVNKMGDEAYQKALEVSDYGAFPHTPGETKYRIEYKKKGV